jgi:translation initiation factor IF-3
VFAEEGNLAGPKRSRGFAPRDIKDKTRVNHNIKAAEVRLIDEDGTQLGVVSIRDAIKLALEKGLDLVEVAQKADPPVCRIIDFGKFKYEQKQRIKAAKKKSSKSLLKELKFRPKIGKHDIDVRVKHARKFLLKGHKVRTVVRFRGREHSHPEIAIEILEKVFARLSDIGDIEESPKKEGAVMLMTVAPNSTKIKAYKLALAAAGELTLLDEALAEPDEDEEEFEEEEELEDEEEFEEDEEIFEDEDEEYEEDDEEIDEEDDERF